MNVLGIDPGATCGWALVDFAFPKTPRFVIGGAAVCVQLGLGDVFAFADARGTQAFMARHEIDLVAIETVGRVFPRAGFGTDMATAIANASKLGGRILGAAEARGIETAECEANEWRQKLGAGRGASDAEVKRALALRIELPRCSAHVRDAVGVALYCYQRALVQGMISAARKGTTT